MHGPATSILLADADEQRRATLAGHLAADEYAVQSAATAREAEVKLRNQAPVLVLVGALDPPTAALELVARVRDGDVYSTGVDPDRPVIVIADAGELGLLRAFDRGADDVVAPDVGYLELRARIRALVRRARGELRGTRLQIAGLTIDRGRRTVDYRGVPVALSVLEFELLVRLASEPATVVDKATLLADVWRLPLSARTRTVDAHACRLRRKLAAAGAQRLVVSCRGVGYSLTDPARERPGQAVGVPRAA